MRPVWSFVSADNWCLKHILSCFRQDYKCVLIFCFEYNKIFEYFFIGTYNK